MLTGLSPWTWRDWTNDRKVDSFKLGTRVLIPQEEIDRVLSEGFRPRLPKVLAARPPPQGGRVIGWLRARLRPQPRFLGRIRTLDSVRVNKKFNMPDPWMSRSHFAMWIDFLHDRCRAGDITL